MFSDFPTWWQNLEMLEKMFWCMAIPFTVFFGIQLILTLFGGDIPEDADVDADIGFQFLTLKNLVAFFTIFGWTGIACLDSGLSNSLSIIIALSSGLAMMIIMASVFYFLSKAVESGTLVMSNAIGGTGEVYMTLKAKRGNIGKVQIQIQNTLRTLEALTDDETDLTQGDVIDVTGLANQTILIVTKSK
jgi:hypothetical protein